MTEDWAPVGKFAIYLNHFPQIYSVYFSGIGQVRAQLKTRLATVEVSKLKIQDGFQTAESWNNERLSLVDFWNNERLRLAHSSVYICAHIAAYQRVRYVTTEQWMTCVL